MRILLDTHVLLSALDLTSRLDAGVQDDIAGPAKEVLFSAASRWRIAIKAAQGRTKFKARPAVTLPGAMQAGFEPVLATHAAAVFEPPAHHKDPFDRTCWRKRS